MLIPILSSMYISVFYFWRVCQSEVVFRKKWTSFGTFWCSFGLNWYFLNTWSFSAKKIIIFGTQKQRKINNANVQFLCELDNIAAAVFNYLLVTIALQSTGKKFFVVMRTDKRPYQLTRTLLKLKNKLNYLLQTASRRCNIAKFIPCPFERVQYYFYCFFRNFPVKNILCENPIYKVDVLRHVWFETKLARTNHEIG